MQRSSSGWFYNLMKVRTGLTSAFGHFLAHLTATTKAGRYKRYKHNRKPPFHRLLAARGVEHANALIRLVPQLDESENWPNKCLRALPWPPDSTTKAWWYKRYKHNRKPPFHRLLAARGVSNMQIPSSGWFPSLIKVKTGLTSAFGQFLGHLTATTKAWRYKRYKHNRKPPFHRLSAARGVSNMQIPSSGWFPNLIKVKTGLTSAFGHFLGHLTAQRRPGVISITENRRSTGFRPPGVCRTCKYPHQVGSPT